MLENSLYIIPAVLVILSQAVIWRKQPSYNSKDTLIEGEYKSKQMLIVFIILCTIIILFTFQFFFTLLPIFNSKYTQTVVITIGYVFVLNGVYISIKALKDLGYSWTALAYYRIKNNQKLVKDGIFKYSRHPIYMSIILQCVGYELIVNSWLFLPMFIFLFLIMNNHINKEEELLMKYYGKEYQIYKNSTKKMFPFIF
ncbi:MAG: isoprenylcysteine carboxylmethyltransferase family protein [Microgenomates group bacterium]